MRLFEIICNCAICAALLFSCAVGCVRKSPVAEDDMLPHVEGKWIGRMEAITVYGARAKTEVYQASALRILKGPHLPHQVPEEVGGGELPILTQYNESLFRIFTPDAAAAGKLVE